MKKINILILSVIALLLSLNINFLFPSTAKAEQSPMLSIVIDDFGGYDQSGVDSMLSIKAPLTCAIMPNLENTALNAKKAQENGHEVILHMPMEANVPLPLSWYGVDYIKNNDNKENVFNKLDKAFSSVQNASGFNIHIGSGVCQKETVLNSIYDYCAEKNKFFLDSRTHLNTVCEKVSNEKNIIYLGRDEFLEPQGNKSYESVKQHIMTGANLAKEKGYSIIIGHVGSHGGENTAKAIKDSVMEIEKMGIKIVPLSKIYQMLKEK